MTQPVAAATDGDPTRVVPGPGGPAGARRRRGAVWGLVLAALVVVGVVLALTVPGMLDPGGTEPTVPSRQQPGASPEAGQGEPGGGSGAPAQPGATGSPRGGGSGAPAQPGATPAPGGGNPEDPEIPAPAPSEPGDAEPTAPADDEPAEPEPTAPAEEVPAPSPGGQAPVATGAP